MHDNRVQEAAYDEKLYPDEPHFWSEPARFAAAAALHGFLPPALGTARILEIGCASGGNIIPMAMRYPGAECVGFDISSRQIAAATAHAQELELSNMAFLHADICSLPDLGRFDYIIAHGVFSWIPPAVRQSLWQACSRLLSDDGLVYMSYNTLPGWHFKRVIRDLLLFRLQDTKLTDGNICETVDYFKQIRANATGLYKQLLDIEDQFVDKNDTGYLRHEYLEEENNALYVQDVLREAGRHEFVYVCEADPAGSNLDTIPPHLHAGAAATRERQEQQIDFYINRTFRRSVFAKSQHAGSIANRVRLDRLDALYILPAEAPPSPRSLAGDSEFIAFPESYFSDTPQAAAPEMQQLALTVFRTVLERLPNMQSSPSIADILAESGATEPAQLKAVRLSILELLYRRHFVLSTQAQHWSFDIALPRLQPQLLVDAKRGRGMSVNILHEKVRFTSDRSRSIMSLLDGTRTVAEIQAAIAVDAEIVQSTIDKIAELKLLF